MEYKYEELKVKNESLENDVIKIKAEKEKLELESKKRIEEYVIFRNKINIEKDMLEFKTNREKEKMYIDLKILMLKEELNLEKEMFKFGIEINNMENKYKLETLNNTGKTFDIISKGLTLLKMFIK